MRTVLQGAGGFPASPSHPCSPHSSVTQPAVLGGPSLLRGGSAQPRTGGSKEWAPRSAVPAGLRLLPLGEAAPSSVAEAQPRVQGGPVCSEVARVRQVGVCMLGRLPPRPHPGLAAESEGRPCGVSPAGPGHVQQAEQAVSRGRAAREPFSAVSLRWTAWTR